MPTVVQFGITNSELYKTLFHVPVFVLLLVIIFFYGLILFLTIIIRSLAFSSLLVLALSCCVSFANLQKLTYRNFPVIPSDILQIKDAWTAANSFSLVWSSSFILCVILSLSLFILLLPLKMPWVSCDKKVRIHRNILCGLLSVTTAVIMFFGVFFNDSALEFLNYNFNSWMISTEYVNNTFYPAFFHSSSVLFQRPPKDYSKAEMSVLANQIQENKNDSSVKADVIILQLESYFHPDIFDITYDYENIFGPFDILGNEGAYGYIISPQIGGGTADVEFEVLTGFTSNDNQCLISPYSVYLFNNFPSFVGYAKQQDYSCISIHSYTTALYNRINAYQYLGFDRSVFDSQFVNPEYRSSWISDKSCIDKIIEEYEKEKNEEYPVLIHTVTMQNHVPISSEMYPENDLVEIQSNSLNDEDILVLKNYLTSDKEISYEVNRLADYLSNTNRNVILIAYGDHQSTNLRAIDNLSGYDIPLSDDLFSLSEEDYFVVTHRTPFIIWTNFDSGLSGEDWGNISPNSLLVKALVKSGVNCPAYFRFFESNSNEIKALSANYVISPDNNLSFEMTEAQTEENQPRLLIQHDILHGERYILNSLY